MKLSLERNSKLNTVLFTQPDGYLNLRMLDTNITLTYLDEQIKKRELSVEKRIKIA